MQNSPTFLISKMEDFSYLKSNDTLSLPANNVKHVLHSQATLFEQYSNNFNNYFQWYYGKFFGKLGSNIMSNQNKTNYQPTM